LSSVLFREHDYDDACSHQGSPTTDEAPEQQRVALLFPRLAAPARALVLIPLTFFGPSFASSRPFLLLLGFVLGRGFATRQLLFFVLLFPFLAAGPGFAASGPGLFFHVLLVAVSALASGPPDFIVFVLFF
jgi:hypothetical protein